MKNTQVKEVMTHNLESVRPDATLAEAARRMESAGCGVLPVGAGERPEGIITDRDIVIRAIARGKDPREEVVRDYMTQDVYCCREDDTLEQAAEHMRRNGVGRLLVEDQNGRVCGIVTFGSMLRKEDSAEEISRIVECAVGEKAA